MKIEITDEAKNEITKVLANEKNAGKLLRVEPYLKPSMFVLRCLFLPSLIVCPSTP